MRILLILRGSPGSGKSTWVDENNLGQYTLCPDDIRLLFQTPILLPDGRLAISQHNDARVWGLNFDLLEERMKRGEFTIIDACHSKNVDFTKYKKLCNIYKYRAFCVDFTTVPKDVTLERNADRESFKQVPVHVIDNMYERFKTFTPQGWISVIKPEEVSMFNEFAPLDFSDYEKIHFIGDLHGCNTVMTEYFAGIDSERIPAEVIRKHSKELFVFLGDYVDRGIENAEVVRFLIDIMDEPNVMFLEGNHEIHLWAWARNEMSKSNQFEHHTRPELEKYGVDRKDVRKLYRKLIQIAYFKYHDKYVIVTHGGISNIPSTVMKGSVDKGVPEYNDLKFIASVQFIKGVGRYKDAKETDDAFLVNTPDNFYSVHGHRNVEGLSVKVNDRCFNLEGDIEHGGQLRCVTLTESGWDIFELQNTVFHKRVEESKAVTVLAKTNVEFIEQLRQNNMIREKPQGNNISSFSFKPKVFYDKLWDNMTSQARGLFINTNSGEIVIRSYNKFFNVNERVETKVPELKKNLKFPVKAYLKYNGFLGLCGYDSESDELILASKSTMNGEFAAWFKDIFWKTVGRDKEEDIKTFLKNNKCAMIFEVIDPENDPHIIEYKDRHIVLLDIVKREIEFAKEPDKELVRYAEMFGFEHKILAYTLKDWPEFYEWMDMVKKEDYKYKGEYVEGFAIEDSAGFMTKLKLEYYSFWKYFRSIKDKVEKGNAHLVKPGSLTTQLHNRLFRWMKEQPKSQLRKDIITVRKKFVKDVKKGYGND